MNQTKKMCLWTIVVAALISTQSIRSEETVQKAREIMKNHQGAMVTVSALCKLDMSETGLPIQIGGLGEAQETSCIGVVVDESGLTVVSYATLNPMEKLGGMMSIRMGEEENGPEIKPKHKLSRVQIHTADGKEIAARVVFKDKELDLAFIMPELKDGEKPPAFNPIKLAAGASAKELDEVVLLTRHAKNLGYQPIVEMTRVSSVITKPRPMYDLTGGVRPGALAILTDGQLLGIVVQPASEEKGGLMGMMESAGQTLVLPTSEITKLAGQAKEAAAKKSKDAGGE